MRNAKMAVQLLHPDQYIPPRIVPLEEVPPILVTQEREIPKHTLAVLMVLLMQLCGVKLDLVKLEICAELAE